MSYRSESRAASARLSKNSQPEVYACTGIKLGVLVITMKSVLHCLPVSSIHRCRGEVVLHRTSSCMLGSCVADMRPIFGGRWCSPFGEPATPGPLNLDVDAAPPSAYPTPPPPVALKFYNCALSGLLRRWCVAWVCSFRFLFSVSSSH